MPGGVGFAVAQEFLPEEGAADGDFAPPEAQHIHDDDGHGQQAEEEEGGGQEGHRLVDWFIIVLVRFVKSLRFDKSNY